EWRSWMKSGKRPSNIPANPQRVYRDEGWIDLYDWLGYEEFLPFEEAREVARSLNLKSSNEWQSWAKSERPSNIPSHPREKYKDQGWVGWYDWLGYEAK
ncbi:hypothetical protein N9545_10000, partial [Salibacteraceae bacterium]|nr:hypothetical protein [Salibacteraceae bacterium]